MLVRLAEQIGGDSGLQVPYDGSVASLRAVLDRIDQGALPAGALSLHTPDLDDVFFALTGSAADQKEEAR
jgi:ABC-2 type transport system ATP-binding protein